nr:hypothetical protein [Tanacetum cinerariifolium]
DVVALCEDEAALGFQNNLAKRNVIIVLIRLSICPIIECASVSITASFMGSLHMVIERLIKPAIVDDTPKEFYCKTWRFWVCFRMLQLIQLFRVEKQFVVLCMVMDKLLSSRKDFGTSRTYAKPESWNRYNYNASPLPMVTHDYA